MESGTLIEVLNTDVVSTRRHPRFSEAQKMTTGCAGSRLLQIGIRNAAEADC